MAPLGRAPIPLPPPTVLTTAVRTAPTPSTALRATTFRLPAVPAFPSASPSTPSAATSPAAPPRPQLLPPAAIPTAPLAVRRVPAPAVSHLAPSRALRVGSQVGRLLTAPVGRPLTVEVPETLRHPIEGRGPAAVGPRHAVALIPPALRAGRVARATQEVQGPAEMAGIGLEAGRRQPIRDSGSEQLRGQWGAPSAPRRKNRTTSDTVSNVKIRRLFSHSETGALSIVARNARAYSASGWRGLGRRSLKSCEYRSGGGRYYAAAICRA